MVWFSIFFALCTAFWAYVTFRDARWEANDEGPSVWEYAFFGVVMTAICGLFTVVCFTAWVL